MITRLLPLVVGILLLSLSSHGQTWNEWMRQKKTQRRYLIEQIAKLQVHLGSVRQGARIMDGGLRLIGDLKNGELGLHRLFFNEQRLVKSQIRLHPAVRYALRHLSQIQHSYDQVRGLLGSPVFSPPEKQYLQTLANGICQLAEAEATQLQTLLTHGELSMTDRQRTDRVTAACVGIERHYTAITALAEQLTAQQTQRTAETRATERFQHLLSGQLK